MLSLYSFKSISIVVAFVTREGAKQFIKWIEDYLSSNTSIILLVAPFKQTRNNEDLNV